MDRLDAIRQYKEKQAQILSSRFGNSPIEIQRNDESIEKAGKKDYTKLVAKKIWITRNGKQIQKTVWVKPTGGDKLKDVYKKTVDTVSDALKNGKKRTDVGENEKEYYDAWNTMTFAERKALKFHNEELMEGISTEKLYIHNKWGDLSREQQKDVIAAMKLGKNKVSDEKKVKPAVKEKEGKSKDEKIVTPSPENDYGYDTPDAFDYMYNRMRYHSWLDKRIKVDYPKEQNDKGEYIQSYHMLWWRRAKDEKEKFPELSKKYYEEYASTHTAKELDFTGHLKHDFGLPGFNLSWELRDLNASGSYDHLAPSEVRMESLRDKAHVIANNPGVREIITKVTTAFPSTSWTVKSDGIGLIGDREVGMLQISVKEDLNREHGFPVQILYNGKKAKIHEFDFMIRDNDALAKHLPHYFTGDTVDRYQRMVSYAKRLGISVKGDAKVDEEFQKLDKQWGEGRSQQMDRDKFFDLRKDNDEAGVLWYTVGSVGKRMHRSDQVKKVFGTSVPSTMGSYDLVVGKIFGDNGQSMDKNTAYNEDKGDNSYSGETENNYAITYKYIKRK